MKKKAKTKRKKLPAFEIDGNIKKFFPPTSPMGFGEPIPYGELNPVGLRKPTKDRLYPDTASFVLPCTGTE